LKKDAFAVDLVYVSSLSNNSAECFPSIVERAKAAGALVATNPGIRQLSARQGQFREVIGKIDILAVNRHEAGVLVPWLVACGGEGGSMLDHRPGETLPDLARRGLSSGGFELSLAAFFVRLRELGPKWVVLTDGKSGAYVSSPSGLLHCPSQSVAVVGTAGAGDAFNSTFSALVAQSIAVDKAVVAATVNAASVVTHIDTQSGLLRRKDLMDRAAELQGSFIVNHWEL
jgi:ribokinase